MTDCEYAARIYCEVFRLENDGGDVYVRGVLDGINTLDEREQYALESYYRNNMNFNQIGEKIGISQNSARTAAKRAVLKLRHPSRKKNMSVAKIMTNSKEQLEEKEKVINELYNQLENVLQGNAISSKLQCILEDRRLTHIEEMDFSVRTYNALKRTGFNTADDLAALDNFEKIKEIRNCGKVVQTEIVAKMREYGFIEWANVMETAI